MILRSGWIRTSGAIAILALLAMGCGGDSGTTPAPPGFDMVGIWDVTAIEGAGVPIDASNSVWTFRANGTYSWWLEVETTTDADGGDWELDGSALRLSGALLFRFGASASLTISSDGNTISLVDLTGDRWTYSRR